MPTKRENPKPEIDPSPLRQGIRMGITVRPETWKWLKQQRVDTNKSYGEILDDFVVMARARGTRSGRNPESANTL